MRIRVLELLFVHQRAALLQQLDDRRVGFEHLQAVIFRQAIVDDSRLIHVALKIEFVVQSGVEVVRAMRGCGVNHACPGVHGHVVRQHAQDVPIQERVCEVLALKLFAGEAGHFARRGKSDLLGESFASFAATM